MKQHYIDGDRPVSSCGKDRLGYRPLGKKLAAAIASVGPSDGWVCGIEGKWGSGKSTLVAFALEELQSGASPPEIVQFSPWLISSRSSLLDGLLTQIEAAALRIELSPAYIAPAGKFARALLWCADYFGPSIRDWWIRRRQLRLYRFQLQARFKGYGTALRLLSGLGPLADAMGAHGLGTASGRALASVASVAESTPNAAFARKSELVDSLRALNRKILVCIDDLDRLEPNEVAEVLRLIRVVADFPNVTYVMAYEPEVVAHSLEVALRVASGQAHLRKFVQATYSMPLPTSFDLQRWFSGEVQLFFEEALEKAGDMDRRDILKRLAEAIRVLGTKYLKTPRDVVRALNAVRLYGAAVRDIVDPADFTWLQLVRLGNRTLHEWIERYVRTVADVAEHLMLPPSAVVQQAEIGALRKIFDQEGDTADETITDLENVLPGIETMLELINGDAVKSRYRPKALYQGLTQELLGSYVSRARLGSPQHYRLYFALTPPVGSVDAASAEHFLQLCGFDREAAKRLFSGYSGQERPQGGSMAEPLLDQVLSRAQQIPTTAVEGLLESIADGADQAAHTEGGDQLSRRMASVWSIADKLFEVLVGKLSSEQRRSIFETLFREGRAIGWLVDIVRGQTYEQGFFGQKAKPREKRLLTEEEFNVLRNAMLKRLESENFLKLLVTPNPLSLLYGWKQAGGAKSLQKAILAQSSTVAGFLNFLMAIRTVRHSSDGTTYPITPTELDNFLPEVSVEFRLQLIAESNNVQQASLARGLLEAIKMGREKF